MRLLRVDYADGATSLDLHPLLTIVGGLTGPERDVLLAHVRQIANGQTIGIRGLAHHGGQLVELDGRGERLGLAPVGLDPILGPTIATRTADERRRRAMISSAQVESIRSELSIGVETEVLALRSRLRALDRPLPAVNGDSQGDQHSGSSGVSELPTEQRSTVDLTTYVQVGQAFVEVQQTARKVRQWTDDLDEVQRQWDALDARWSVANQQSVRLQDDVDRAVADQTAAEVSLRAAQESVKPRLLTPEQEQRLIALVDRAELSNRRWRRASPPDGAEQAELDSLLSIVGVSSWTEYSLYRLGPKVPPERLVDVDAAKQHLAETQEQLVAAREALDGDAAVIADLEAERESFCVGVEPLLGPVTPEDIAEALLAAAELRLNPKWERAVASLCRVLDQVELQPELSKADTDDAEVDFERTSDQILAWTKGWLAAEEAEMAKQQRAAQSAGPLDEPPLTTADAGSVDGSPPSADSPGDEADVVEVEQLQVALADAQRRLARHRSALDRLVLAEEQYWRDVLAISSPNGGSRAAQDGSQVDVTVNSLADRVAVAVGKSAADPGGPVPIVIDLDGLENLDGLPSLLDRCRDMSTECQIIVLVDDPQAAQWAADVGPAAAFCVQNGVKLSY